MKRLRLLIYEGDAKWIQTTREHEWAQGTKNMGTETKPMRVTSIELNPLRMTVLELVRVLFGKEQHEGDGDQKKTLDTSPGKD